MRSRLLVSVLALALTGAITSCDDDGGITDIGEGLDDTATWIASLNAANERQATPVNSPAVGRAWFTDNGNAITYYIEYEGLVAPLSGRSMQRVYLVLAAIGYLAAGVPMLMESARSGNILFWTDPRRTNAELFVNLTSTAFALDLLAVVLVALIWITREARRLGIPRLWMYWVLTLLFGLGGTLPLFLSVREGRLERRAEGA